MNMSRGLARLYSITLSDEQRNVSKFCIGAPSFGNSTHAHWRTASDPLAALLACGRNNDSPDITMHGS